MQNILFGNFDAAAEMEGVLFRSIRMRDQTEIAIPEKTVSHALDLEHIFICIFDVFFGSFFRIINNA